MIKKYWYLIILLNLIFSWALLSQDNHQDIYDVFNKYFELNNKYKTLTITSTNTNSSVKEKMSSEAENIRKEIDSYSEQEFYPKLKISKNIILEKKDGKLLLEVFRVLCASANLSDNQLSSTIAEIFIANPEIIINIFRPLSDNNKILVYKELEFGFLNIIYEKENNLPNYQELHDKLKLLNSLIKK